GELNGACIFNPTARDEGQGMPLVATLDAPGLSSLREAIVNEVREAAKIPPDNHGFVPHMTLAYLTDPLPDAEGGDETSTGPAMPLPSPVPLTFADLVVAWPDTQTHISLLGDFDAAARGVEEAIELMPDEATGGEDESTPAPPDVTQPAASMGLAEGDAVPVDGPAAQPDEGRVIPTPGPLGMWEACLVTEDVPTDEVMDEGDGTSVRGRFIPAGTLTWREPPLPIGFAVNRMGSPADNGHLGAPVAGAATEVWRDGNRIMARGPYLDNADGMALKEAVDGGAPIGPSIDLGASDVWEIITDATGTSRATLQEGSVAGAVVLPYEAQHSGPDGEWLTWFRSVEAETPAPEAMPAEMPAVVPIAASALTACAAPLFGAPLYPPMEWLMKPAPNDGSFVGVTILDSGQGFAHIAGGTCHIGIPGTCVKVSDGLLSRDFSLFHKGLQGSGRGIKTAEGQFVQVGQITLAGGHADTRLSADHARQHYDNTDSVIANARISWDEAVGLPWAAFAIAGDATEAQVQRFRAAGEVSVDYRQLEDGKLHLIALPVVPRGGFPPMRALSAGGEIRSLILTASSELGPTGGSVTDKTWDGDASRFSDDQYQKACAACDPLADTTVKQACFLPHHEPEGTINRNGVHAAAQRVGSLSGHTADAVTAAKAHLRNHYRTDLKEEPPDNLGQPSQSVAADGLLLDLAHDFYGRQLEAEAGLLASAHRSEAQRLGKALTSQP
ncbi:MAG: hypothetical protein ABR532_08930, partial [Candidatus Dormibacteria bacterium]